MAAAAADLERRVMAAVKASAARGDPPLLQATEAARCARGASASGGLALAPALVANLCFAHNTGAMWKLLDQAMASRLVCPLHTLALLTARVVPNRQEQPEAYRLYLELLSRYVVAPVYPHGAETKAMLAKSIDDALQISEKFGFQHLDFGHTVTLFIFSLIKITIDCILEGCGSPSNSVDEHVKTYTKNIDSDCNGASFSMGHEHREHLRRKNILMSVEVVERITANKMVQDRPEHFNILLQRLQPMGALKLKNIVPASLVDSLMKNIQKIIRQGYPLGRSRLLGVLVSSQRFSSATFSMFGPGRGSYWIQFDMFMEYAMDGRQLHAISSVAAFTELSKTLQVLNRATWQETFQALWISALRLLQRSSDTMEGPFPHIDSRLCMLLAIIPLSIATIVNEEAEKLEGGMVSIMRGELLSSIQALGQFFSLLSPPPGTVHLANAAARKAALHLSNIRARNENMCTSFEDSSSIKAVGNMLHLIVEACIARNLIDTSAYLWPGYVVPVKEYSLVEESPWSTLLKGFPLMELKDALMVTPASTVGELEKLYSFAVLGSEEEKLAASKILCGASLLRGWNIQEHVVQMVLKLLSTFLPLDCGSDGRYLQHMPVLHALISGISSLDVVHILSIYGLVPEVAAMLMPLCEIFGSLPPSDNRSCNLEKASVYSVFSCAFLSLLRLWKFHRPPVENALSRHGVSIWSELRLDVLLLLRNSGSALKNLSSLSGTDIFLLDPSFQKPVYIDSFPKLRAWYFQNQACIASTLCNVCKKTSVVHIANMMLKIMCRKMSNAGGLSLINPQRTSNSSMSSSPPGVQEDNCQWPCVPAWEVLEAVPFVLEAVLTACAHGKISSRDLITGLRDLADFLPASLATIVSYFSEEVTRGTWKPVMLNGSDWPSPAATLSAVESEIKEVLASAGVHISISAGPRSVMPMLPLPVAALISFSITIKMEEFSPVYGIIGQRMQNCATSSAWPSMSIIGALWSQKVRRWHDFIILSCSQSPFTRENTAIAQLIRSCFLSFLCSADGFSFFTPHKEVTNLLGHTLDRRGPRLSVSPGFLYVRSCQLFPDNNFVCEEILKVLIETVRALANDFSSDRLARLRSGCRTLSSASSSVQQIASLAATMLCLAGGSHLIRLLYEHVLPTLLLSAGDEKLGSAGQVCSMFEGFALAYVLLMSGANVWGVGKTSPAYTSIYISKRQRVVDRHLEFMAKAMEGNIVLGCGEATWRAYVLCFVGLLVDFAPTWISEVKLETLQKMASGLRKWHEGDLAISLLERGGNKAISSVVESLLVE